jgi:hypothetical protein
MYNDVYTHPCTCASLIYTHSYTHTHTHTHTAVLLTDQAAVEAVIAENDAVVVAFADSLEAVPVFTQVRARVCV